MIYVLRCPCNLLYVGETTCECKPRYNPHRYTIGKRRLPVPKHFAESNHSDVRFMLVDHIAPRGGDRLTLLKKREPEWIFKLNTLGPRGLNVDFSHQSDELDLWVQENTDLFLFTCVTLMITLLTQMFCLYFRFS